MKFQDIKNTYEYKNDRACCTVVASSVAFNQDFTHTQNFYNTHGRQKNRGLEDRLCLKLLKDYASEVGGQVKTLDPKEITGGATLTVGNSIKYLDKAKNYVMFSSGHAIGVSKGEVQDWSAKSKRPVKKIYCITPPQEKAKAITQFTQLKLF